MIGVIENRIHLSDICNNTNLAYIINRRNRYERVHISR